MKSKPQPLIRCNVCFLFYCACRRKRKRAKSSAPRMEWWKRICVACGNRFCTCALTTRAKSKRRQNIKRYQFKSFKRPLRIKNIKKPVRIKQPIKVKTPLEVEADRLDIRPLDPTTDQTQVYGTDGYSTLPIRTDEEGRLLVVSNERTNPVSTRQYQETRFANIETIDEWTFMPSQDTSNLITYTYIAINRGNASVRVKVELSPNDVHYQTYRESVVPPSDIGIVVPAYFLRFARIAVRAEDANDSTTVDVYFQAQQ